jgi:hypothetical protein
VNAIWVGRLTEKGQNHRIITNPNAIEVHM